MKLFWIDPKREIKKSYTDLIADLNRKQYLAKKVAFGSPYKIYLEFIASLISGKSIELVDTTKSEILNNFVKLNLPLIRKVEDIISLIQYNKNKWSLYLYTSGTTGRPRRVKHRLDNLTKSVTQSPGFSNQIWAFAYNPTHIAGILVFLQAFLNNNTIVYLFDSKSSKVGEIISKYKITHISATPSFYRMLLGACRKNLSLIDQVTVGGERLDEILEKDLRKVFPNAKITNIYATTETGSLLKSSGSAFKIPNKYRNQIKISKDNELIIHHSLLGEMFSKNLKDGWYYTKDIVEWINKNEFIIISRKDDIINVGGYMVNPANIEFQLKKISGIVDARVTARKNKITGNILQADIVKKEGESKEKLETVIIKQLEKYLSQWEIPRIIKFVSKMDLTRTYKVSRQ